MPGWSIHVKGCRKGSVKKPLRVENRILRWSVSASRKNRLFGSQELEPKIGEELCGSWDVDQAGPSVRTPRSTNNTNRRGKPSVPTQSDRHPSPSQWQATQANVGYPAIQQVYTAHTPSFPIPVPILSARHATLPIILAIKLWQPSPWLYILTPLFPLKLTLLRWNLSFI